MTSEWYSYWYCPVLLPVNGPQLNIDTLQSDVIQTFSSNDRNLLYYASLALPYLLFKRLLNCTVFEPKEFSGDWGWCSVVVKTDCTFKNNYVYNEWQLWVKKSHKVCLIEIPTLQIEHHNLWTHTHKQKKSIFKWGGDIRSKAPRHIITQGDLLKVISLQKYQIKWFYSGSK